MSNDLCHSLFLSPAVVSCFDGEGGAGAGEGGAGTAVVPDPNAGGANPPPKTFTQEQLNAYLADERRKTETKYKVNLEKTEKSLQELLAKDDLSQSERKALEESLESTKGLLRTKEEEAKIKEKALKEEYAGKLNVAEQRAQDWEQRYRGETINRSIMDAAVSADAFNPTQINAILRPMTKLIEVVDEKTGKPTGRFEPMVDFPDVDAETGEPIMTTRTPTDAVKRMQEKSEYQNLFKANVVSGIGSNSTTGLSPGQGGKVDVRKLSPAQYRELRAKNPAALGLRPRAGSR